MPTLDDVYRKFGEASEAAQLLETQLGTAQLFLRGVHEGLITPSLEADGKHAAELLKKIDRQTLGQHIKETKQRTNALDKLEPLLSAALKERNRLTHDFYRQHNIRKNTDAGRAVMLADLESIHSTLLEAFKALMLLSGIDLDALVERPDARRWGIRRRRRHGNLSPAALSADGLERKRVQNLHVSKGSIAQRG